MRLYADSADLAAVAPLVQGGLVAGVTCNPTILDKAGKTSADIPDIFRELQALGCKQSFFQAVGGTAKELREDADKIVALGADVIVKLPATWDGFVVAAELVKEGRHVLITAVHSIGQVIMAASIGVEFVAPYYGSMLDKGQDADRLIRDMLSVCGDGGTKVVAASIRTPGALRQLVTLGVREVTAVPTVLDDLIKNELTQAAVQKFETKAQKWRSTGITW